MQENKRLRRFTLVIACGASFVVPFLSNSLNLAVPAIGETFQASTTVVSWVVNAFLLSSAIFLLPFGRLGDIIGRKKLFIPGLLMTSVSSLLCAVAWSIEWFIVFRVIQGISAAMGFSTGIAILTSVYPPGERGKVLGINSAVVYLGLSLGTVLGGVLIFNWGWVSIFIISGTFNLILFLLAVTQLKGESSGSPGVPFDWIGSVIFVIGIAALLYGLSSLNEHWVYWLVVAFGLLLLFIFGRHEYRIEHPLLPLRTLLHNRTFAFLNLATLINYVSTFATMFLMSLYLQRVLDFDSRVTGFILLAQPIVMAVSSPFTGRLSDRINPRRLSSLGLSISMLSLLLFTFINISTPAYLIVANLIFGGVGFGLFATPTSNAVLGSVDKSLYGMASSTTGSMRLIGQSTSITLAALILSRYVGSVQLSHAAPEQLLSGIKTAFTVFCVICVAGVVATLHKERPSA